MQITAPETAAIATMENAPALTEAFKTSAVAAGITDGTVSRQWAMRPADERFTSLTELRAMVDARTLEAATSDFEMGGLRMLADQADSNSLRVLLPSGQALSPTNWSLSQLATKVGVPASYLSRSDMPAILAGVNLQWAIDASPEAAVQGYFGSESGKLRALTSQRYGRIRDLDLVDAVAKIAGNGTGDTRWKVPGSMDFHGKHNPFVDVTKDNTTLYASDRDVFLFLVDDTHPIEIGKLPDGSPDLVFRGFYCWNSEVGSRTMGLSTFLLRGVCCNRNIWGGQDQETMVIRHMEYAPGRFESEIAPALLSYSEGAASSVVAEVEKLKAARLGGTDQEVLDWLGDRGFTKSKATAVMATVLKEEQAPLRSIWDVVQGLSAMARSIEHQDKRLDAEIEAGKFAARVLA